MKPTVTSPSQKGLLIALPLVLFAVVTTVLKLEGNKNLGGIPLVVLIAGVIWACRSFSKQMEGNVTFGKIFGHGFKASAIVAAIMGLWIAISFGLLFPEALDRIMEMQRAEIAKSAKMSDEQLDQAMSLGRKFILPTMCISAVILYLFIGAIAALVGAAVAKKNPNPQPFDQIGN
jgi:L-cystine uptake protein TcyP (sodium:dicarboxylate symporter family)